MLDIPNRDKIIRNPAAKKEYHFASTAEHLAEVIHADTIQEAEQIYHRVKRLIHTPVEQSTRASVQDALEKEIQ